MKTSSAGASRGPISRQTAWGCFTANAALPGAGSLAGRRRIGYGQMALAFLGLAISTASTARFFAWYIANYERFREPVLEDVVELLRALAWPGAGMGIFGLAWVWALLTSLQILRQARRESPPAPPKLG